MSDIEGVTIPLPVLESMRECTERLKQLEREIADITNWNVLYVARMEELEELCRDLWVYAMRPQHGGIDGASLFCRMQDLGLLEGEQ